MKEIFHTKKFCITYKPENSFILEIVCLNLNDLQFLNTI